LNRQDPSPESSSTVFAIRATVQGTWAYSGGNKKSPDVILGRSDAKNDQMPKVDEKSLYHIIFCRYPDISVPLLSFFPQVRQRRFVQDIDTDLFRDLRQYFSAGPFIEKLSETSARQAPAILKGTQPATIFAG
jgi:hypothetical protein